MRRRTDLQQRAADQHDAAIAKREQAGQLEESTDFAACETCGQELGKDARARTVATLRADADELDAQATKLDVEAGQVEIPNAGQPDAAKVEQLRQRLAAARADQQQRARLEERLRTLEEKVAAAARPEYRDELAALTLARDAAKVALDALGDDDGPTVSALEVDHRAAAADVDRLRDIRSRDEQQLAVARDRLAGAELALAELERLAGETAELRDRVDLLALAERAYGRDGIPALIVEASAIPTIETEANRLLEQLGAGYTVELRTQRALKTGDGLRETLDIIVTDELGSRPYETFSGGEETRLNLALRIALAKLLANRRGAESRLLVIDEPDGLDGDGFDRLEQILRELHADFDVILVISHHPDLRDAFEQALVVSMDGDRSRVAAAAAPEAVAA
jgi:exonuclease SbcC